MSRGPGRIERAVAALLQANPNATFTVSEIAERIYQVKHATASQIQSVRRALRHVLIRPAPGTMATRPAATVAEVKLDLKHNRELLQAQGGKDGKGAASGHGLAPLSCGGGGGYLLNDESR
jgi:hypothetical protein